MLGDRKNSFDHNLKGEYAAEAKTPVSGIGFRKKINSIVHRRISMADIQPNLKGSPNISRTNLMDNDNNLPNIYTMPAT